MNKTLVKKTCSLCNSKTLEFKETLYGAIICQPCHNVLMRYGFKGKEEADRQVRGAEIDAKINLENYRKNISLGEPHSETRRKIAKMSFLIGGSTSFL